MSLETRMAALVSHLEERNDAKGLVLLRRVAEASEEVEDFEEPLPPEELARRREEWLEREMIPARTPEEQYDRDLRNYIFSDGTVDPPKSIVELSYWIPKIEDAVFAVNPFLLRAP